ncbi:MAG: LuxR family transcriptional regulator [Legionella longbeachae]|nr:LuxR family transcriptional regulator [Legionella longbeachae]
MKKFNRIFIVGQLGSGKGMLAKALADKLNLKMIDLDFGLERHIGKPINAILGVDGTSYVELIINFVSNKLNFENLSSHEKSNNLNTIIFHKKTHKPINLTTQQAHCIKLLADGKSAKEIAREINISHRTVEGHLATAMETTGCANSKELIALYLS